MVLRRRRRRVRPILRRTAALVGELWVSRNAVRVLLFLCARAACSVPTVPQRLRRLRLRLRARVQKFPRRRPLTARPPLYPARARRYFADFAEVPVRSNDDQDVRTSLAELLEGNFGSTASANAPAAAPAAATDPVSPATPNQVVRNFDAAMASLSSGSGGSTWRGDGAVAAAASSTVLIQAPAVAQLRDLSLRVRESQSELDTRSADLQSGLFATIEALQESHARAESMLNDKIRECEQLRAENEKLQMYLKLHANTEVAGTPGRW